MKFDNQRPMDAHNFFDHDSIVKNKAFIDTLKPDDIKRFRAGYKREMNSSNELNELPITTVEERRCFLFLTSQYENN